MRSRDEGCKNDCPIFDPKQDYKAISLTAYEKQLGFRVEKSGILVLGRGGLQGCGGEPSLVLKVAGSGVQGLVLRCFKVSG